MGSQSLFFVCAASSSHSVVPAVPFSASAGRSHRCAHATRKSLLISTRTVFLDASSIIFMIALDSITVRPRSCPPWRQVADLSVRAAVGRQKRHQTTAPDKSHHFCADAS